jgi:hypothetical protein
MIIQKGINKMKICIACGMPMMKTEDFPLGDENKDYCIYCARPDGTMQSYEEKLEGTTDFLVKTQVRGLAKCLFFPIFGHFHLFLSEF